MRTVVICAMAPGRHADTCAAETGNGGFHLGRNQTLIGAFANAEKRARLVSQLDTFK